MKTRVVQTDTRHEPYMPETITYTLFGKKNDITIEAKITMPYDSERLDLHNRNINVDISFEEFVSTVINTKLI
jgi:hypothetical protein